MTRRPCHRLPEPEGMAQADEEQLFVVRGP